MSKLQFYLQYSVQYITIVVQHCLTEEKNYQKDKTKVVAALWGRESIQFLAALQYSNFAPGRFEE